MYVYNNVDKVGLQNNIQNYELNGGKAIISVNGLYTDNLNLKILDISYIEVVYDQSIISKEKYNISNLRTFNAFKDNKLKYFLFKEKIINKMQYYDDNEIYISTDNELVTRGLYFYVHKDYAVRNVTEKDYNFYTSFINNTALALTNITFGSINDKIIVFYTRKLGLSNDPSI